MNKLFGVAGIAAIALASTAVAQQTPTGLHGIKIAVADYDRATRFYSILGMTPGTQYNALEWELRWADPAGGSVVIMVKDPSGRIRVTKGGASLMVSVANVGDTVERLRTAGFSIPGKPMVTPRATILMLQDPDGNWVELLGPGAAAPTAATPPEHDHGH